VKWGEAAITAKQLRTSPGLVEGRLASCCHCVHCKESTYGHSQLPPSPPFAGLGMKLGMGLTAGAVGQLVAVPADLIKVGSTYIH
jgi:hypothetical protein